MNKHVKKILIAMSVMLGALVVVAIGYLIYLAASYSRMQDKLPMAVSNNTTSQIQTSTEYEILTYNIGFGAYSPEYSFFMDTGEMLDGKKVSGKYGKGISKDSVRKNTNGIVSLIDNLEYDFVLAQEVDEDGDRSYNINQVELIKNAMDGYASVYAKNFHSAYLYYPFNDPHGQNDSGLLTLSKYHISSAARYSLPVATNFSKFFDLDRCFSVIRVPIDNVELVIINVHLSAYDKGGVIRAEQLKVLSDFLNAEKEKGNYIIAGGDFNHDISNSIDKFKTQQKLPEWVATFSSDELGQGFSIAKADNCDLVPTCRSSDMPYQKDVNYTVVIDGFIVSDNIEVVSVENQDTQFAYSDHNPVHMKFILR